MLTRGTLNKRLLIVIEILAVVAIGLVITGCPRKPKPLSGGGIHGHVAVILKSNQDDPKEKREPLRIELPDAKVTAKNVTTGVTSAAIVTNAHGYFQLPHLPPGAYQVCADAPNFTTGCLSTNVSVTNFSVVLSDDVLIQPKDAVIAGSVLLGNRKPCFNDRPAFHTFVTAKVTLEDASHNKVAGPVQGNGIGQYVLPAVSAGQYELVANCQSGEGRVPLTVASGQVIQDVIIPNLPPALSRIEASVGSQPVRVAPAGATVDLKAIAQDPDANPLTFKWADSNGTNLGATAATMPFALPATTSTTQVFVEVNDGRGGFAYSMIPVTGADNKEVLFTGKVVDAGSEAPVDGAEVTVNGRPTTSDAKGLVAIMVPRDVRYAVSVHKVGFALLSKVTYSPAAELRLPLQAVSPQNFNVGEGGIIVARGDPGQLQPVRLNIPPNSLVDKNGAPASGTGRSYLWRYPPGTPIPGDMSGIFRNRPMRLETFGAVDIELTDMADQPLQVKPGSTLELFMSPAGPNPPPTIPLFHFDKDKGLWLESGQWQLTGGQYHATLTHLTPFNADLAFGTTGCIEYHVDVNNSPTLPFYLHIEQNGQSANHEPFQVNDFAGVVSRLRPGEATDWWALPTATSPTTDAIGHGSVVASTFTSDPNDPTQPPDDFPDVGATFPNPPHNPICTVFNIEAQFPSHETYLTGLPGPSSPTDEANYTGAVDTWGAGAGPHTNFTDFKNTNGFPTNESSAVYFNNGDLRLGRDMHCRVASGNRIACYVSNYSDHALPPAGSATALLAAASAHTSGNTNLLFATVAMEWDPGQPVGTSVQFYVYNAMGNRVTQAALDSEGGKSVPQICMACHGGFYDSAGDHLAHESRFLPFDLASFRLVDDDFSASAVSQLNLNAFTRQNQLGQFRALNALIAQTETGGQSPRPVDSHGINAVLDLITGWYAGCGGVNNAACGTCVGGVGCPDSFRSNYRPTGWNSQPALYDNIVRPDCRGCHVMQPTFAWTDIADFTGPFKGLIQTRVCTNPQRRMPHAEVPFKAFWQNNVGSDLLKQAPMSFPQCQR